MKKEDWESGDFWALIKVCNNSQNGRAVKVIVCRVMGSNLFKPMPEPTVLGFGPIMLDFYLFRYLELEGVIKKKKDTGFLSELPMIALFCF